MKPWKETPIAKGIDNLKSNFNYVTQKIMGIGNKDASADAQLIAQPNSTDGTYSVLSGPKDQDVYSGSHTQKHSGDDRLTLRSRPNREDLKRYQ